jgi:hypothetical protein
LLQSETNDVTTDHIEVKSFIKEYHEWLFSNKLDSLD